MIEAGKALGGSSLQNPNLNINLLNPQIFISDGWECNEKVSFEHLCFGMFMQPEAWKQGSAYIDGTVTEDGPTLDVINTYTPVLNRREIVFPRAGGEPAYLTRTQKLDLTEIPRPLFLVPMSEEGRTAERIFRSLEQQRMMGRYPLWMSPSITGKDLKRIDSLADLCRELAISEEQMLNLAPWDDNGSPWHVYFAFTPRFDGDTPVLNDKKNKRSVYLSDNRLAISVRGNQIINCVFVDYNCVLPSIYRIYIRTFGTPFYRDGAVFTRTAVEPFREFATSALSGVPYAGFSEIQALVGGTELRLDVVQIEETIKDAAEQLNS